MVATSGESSAVCMGKEFPFLIGMVATDWFETDEGDILGFHSS